MAFDNLEIEIKIKLDINEFKNVSVQLSKVSNFVNQTKQIDKYFIPKHDNYLKERNPFKWFSIRHRDNKSILNFKHFFPEDAETHTYCKEYETEIFDLKSMIAILTELDIYEVVEINKTRDRFIVDDKFEICLDTVADLGHYLEIEAIKDQGGIENTKNEMKLFLSSLGLNTLNIDYKGYPYNLLLKKGIIEIE